MSSLLVLSGRAIARNAFLVATSQLVKQELPNGLVHTRNLVGTLWHLGYLEQAHVPIAVGATNVKRGIPRG